MYVRMARFEGIDVSQVDADAEQFRTMLSSDEGPEWMQADAFATLRDGVARVISLVDRDAAVSVDLFFSRTAEDARRVDETLSGLTPPEGVGRRTSVETFEVLFDEQRS